MRSAELRGPLGEMLKVDQVHVVRHKVLIEAVDPEGGLLTSQSITFDAPGK